MDPDSDLEDKGREELVVEIRALRAAIREHRDSTGMDLSTLPEALGPAAGARRAGNRGTRMAAIHPRLRALPPEPRRAAAGRAPYHRGI